jgi:hypothetical protein
MTTTHQHAHTEQRAPSPIQIPKFGSSLDYPVDKQRLIQKGQEEGADDNVLHASNRIPDRTYDSPIAVSREVGRLESHSQEQVACMSASLRRRTMPAPPPERPSLPPPCCGVGLSLLKHSSRRVGGAGLAPLATSLHSEGRAACL